MVSGRSRRRSLALPTWPSSRGSEDRLWWHQCLARLLQGRSLITKATYGVYSSEGEWVTIMEGSSRQAGVVLAESLRST